MLIRFLITLCAIALPAGCNQLSPAEKNIVGTWKNDASAPGVRFDFGPDHSFNAGNEVATFIVGSWRVEAERLVVSQVKAAGKPIAQSDCGGKIVSVTKD